MTTRRFEYLPVRALLVGDFIDVRSFGFGYGYCFHQVSALPIPDCSARGTYRVVFSVSGTGVSDERASSWSAHINPDLLVRVARQRIAPRQRPAFRSSLPSGSKRQRTN